MDFTLKDARPIWQQLADQMTESIVTGEYSPGERFPSVRELAMQAGGYGTSTADPMCEHVAASGSWTTMRWRWLDRPERSPTSR